MTKARKTGLEAALEAAAKSGMALRTKPAAAIERDLAASIRDVTTGITPYAPARLKLMGNGSNQKHPDHPERSSSPRAVRR